MSLPCVCVELCAEPYAKSLRLDIKRNENIAKRKQESRQKFLQHVRSLEAALGGPSLPVYDTATIGLLAEGGGQEASDSINLAPTLNGAECRRHVRSVLTLAGGWRKVVDPWRGSSGSITRSSKPSALVEPGTRVICEAEISVLPAFVVHVLDATGLEGPDEGRARKKTKGGPCWTLQMSAENQGARPQTQASRLEKERQRQRRIAVEAGGFCRKPIRD